MQVATSSTAALAAASAAGGAIIATGLSGGNLGQTLKAGLIAGVTAFAFFEVGSLTFGPAHASPAFDSPDFDVGKYAANVAGHAAVGCGQSVASGASCGSGALSGAVGSALSPLTNAIFPNARTNLAERIGGTIVEATAGGLASVAGGGKFANGAITAAFGYLFNDLICDRGSCYGQHPTKDEIDTHYRDGTGWTVYAAFMDPAWLDSSQFNAIPIGSSGLIHTDWLKEVSLDYLNPFRNVGDRNIYGDFTATRVDGDHFLWNDTYNFDTKPGYSPSIIARNAATIWGSVRAGQFKGGVGFDIIGVSPVRIP